MRHGETEWSAAGRHTGSTDMPLTSAGRAAAQRIGQLVAPMAFAAVFTSPLGRARETCSLAGLAADAVVDEDLREWDYGGYEGVTTADIRRQRPTWDLWADGVVAGPAEHPGETLEEVGARADRVLARADAALGSAAPGDGDVVLVAHGHFLRVLTARRLGLPPGDGALFQLSTGTVSRLGTEHGRPVLTSWNQRP